MRLIGLDIARFLAFTGMVLVNFRIAAQVSGTNDWAAQITQLFEGRAAALFVVLAGAGITLANAPAALMAKRALFLFTIGLLNQTIFEADILHYYGVYFLCAIPLMRLSSNILAVSTALIIAASLAMLLGLNYEAGWNWDSLEYADFWTAKGFVRNLFYNGWHPVFPWVAFLAFGMWLGRQSLANQTTQIKLTALGSLWAIAIITLSAAVRAALSTGLSTDPGLVEITGLGPIPPGPLYILAGIGTSTAMIGATLLITPLLTRLNIAEWLAAPGRQTLTLYVAHILIGMGVLEGMGRLDGSLTSPMIFALSIGFATLTALYARAWLRINRRGPLESLMRMLTEGQPK